MWWLVFTAIDLYIGLVAIDLLARSDSLPAPKLARLGYVKKGIWVAIGIVVVAIVIKLWR